MPEQAKGGWEEWEDEGGGWGQGWSCGLIASPSNPYAETLTPSVALLGDRVFRGD